MVGNNSTIKQFNHAPHICQSPEWGEVKARIGTPVVRVGGVQFTLHKVPFLPFNVGYCPKVDPEKIDWERLKDAAKEHRCIFVKIEPLESVKVSRRKGGQAMCQCVNGATLRRSKPIFAMQTILLDLTKPEEELRAGMKQKTRYNVRLAEKKGVVVEERHDPEALEIFLQLQKETAQRQGFFIHPDNYYRTVWEVLHPKKMAHLLVASVKQPATSNQQPAIPVVAWMLLKYRDTFYYPYGGSSERFKNFMPSNLVMWEAIRQGKKLGCKTFDLWGATDDPQDPWYGFTRFKLGYGGRLVSFPGAYDLILNPVLYWPFIFVDKIRWGWLKFRGRFL